LKTLQPSAGTRAPRFSGSTLELCGALLLGLAALTAHAAQVGASALLGVVVLNAQGEKLGNVRDLAVDVNSGAVAHVIVEYRDPDARGPRLRPVPPAEGASAARTGR
jgi:hypothetical protein